MFLLSCEQNSFPLSKAGRSPYLVESAQRKEGKRKMSKLDSLLSSAQSVLERKQPRSE